MDVYLATDHRGATHWVPVLTERYNEEVWEIRIERRGSREGMGVEYSENLPCVCFVDVLARGRSENSADTDSSAPERKSRGQVKWRISLPDFTAVYL